MAVIGMAGRFPGACDLDRYWRLLAGRREGIRRFTEPDLRAAGVAAELVERSGYVPARGVLDGAYHFDCRFFGFSPAEAATIDPQQRVFLECASGALDDAGLDPHRFPGLVGVYAGADAVPPPRSELDPLLAVIGREKDFLATRVAYKLGLRGPAVTVQTACSTSLTAIHTAMQSLLAYECDAALAGGVSVGRPDQRGYLYQEGGILSRDGHCRPFDADADGTVPSEGVGVVVLKRELDALRDGDRIVAVIRGSALNNDGGDKIGFTAPSLTGQREVIELAMKLAGVDPADIGYVEAHGTATRIGTRSRCRRSPTPSEPAPTPPGSAGWARSSRTSGTPGRAAGVAGFIKAALMLNRGELVPTVHYRDPNPLLDLESTPFVISTRNRPWPADGVRLAGVSSFGVGGTNAHAVLSAPPRPARTAVRVAPRVFVVSAASATGLDRLKLGIYTSAGTLTCARTMPGSLDHEVDDAQSFADWGVDYLKYDNCNDEGRPAFERYKAMGDALAATGRDIVYALCEWGANKPWEWGDEVGADLWRTTGDISDTWSSMTGILDQQVGLEAYPGPGSWNDPDMLEVGNGGMTTDEYRAHFALWALLNAPLIAGDDVRTMDATTRSILANRDLIAVNQDFAGIQGHKIRDDGDREVWAKPMSDGSATVVLFNRGSETTAMSATAAELGLGGRKFQMRDLWTGSETESAGTLRAAVSTHGAAAYRVWPARNPQAAPHATLELRQPALTENDQPFTSTARLFNDGTTPLKAVTVRLTVPEGWEVDGDAEATEPVVALGRSWQRSWSVRPVAPTGTDVAVTANASYTTRFGPRRLTAGTSTLLRHTISGRHHSIVHNGLALGRERLGTDRTRHEQRRDGSR